MSITDLNQIRNRRTPSDTHTVQLTQARVSRAKAAYTTRRTGLAQAAQLLTGEQVPVAGDLVLARVVQLRQHKRLELASGRRAHLRIGDEIIVAYGSRYAPDQFEAYLPGDLGPCDLVAAGGLAARCRSKHSGMKQPTRIEPIGLLADSNGQRLNLARWSLPEAPATHRRPTVIAVVGTMMNAGKTTCAADLVHGYKSQGLRVGAAKVTGTGSGCDRWVLTDAGADQVLDFTDMGVPSTFGLAAERVEAIFEGLVDNLAADDMQVVVIEIADGIYQEETAELLHSPRFKARCDGLLFAAGDGCGALTGVQHLQSLGHRVLAVGGALTASPLAVREARQVIDLPVVTSRQLSTAEWLPAVERATEEVPEASVSEMSPAAGRSPFVKWMVPASSLSSGF